MLRRSIKVLASITATAAVIITVLIVATVAFPVDQSEFNSPNSVRANETVHSDTVDALWCERYVVAFTIETDDAGEIVGFKSATDPAEMQKCIEAFKDGRISFDPRDLGAKLRSGLLRLGRIRPREYLRLGRARRVQTALPVQTEKPSLVDRRFRTG